MSISLLDLKAGYIKEDYDIVFQKINKYVESFSLQQLISASESNYLDFKKENYKTYKKARLEELKKDGKYLDIIFHLVVRKIKPISRKIIKAKGWNASERYLNGKPFFYQFELFSLNNSLDSEQTGKTYLGITDLKENFEKYEALYARLGDEKSKIVFNAILMARLSKDPMYYFGINDQPSDKAYFDRGLVHCDENEVFVDCGGYIGDTVMEYMMIMGQKYKRIYVYEPSPANYEKAKYNLAGYMNIVVRKMGVSNQSGTVSFSDGSNEAATVSDDGRSSIELTTLDEDIIEKVTFIKMDIEGQELQALHGAEFHIQNDKPKLSICLYHKFDDLWKIPEYVYKVNKDYKLYLRHYQNCYTENYFVCDIMIID